MPDVQAETLQESRDKINAFAAVLESLERPDISRDANLQMKIVVFAAAGKIRKLARELS